MGTVSQPDPEAARPRLAALTAEVGLWDWDLRTNRVYFSPEWKRQIGWEDQEIPGSLDEWQRRVHPEDLGRVLQQLRACLSRPGEDYRDEFRFQHKDGSYRWILAQGAVLNDEQGKPVRLLGSHVDITGRKQEEAEARHAEAIYRSIFENAVDGIFQTTPEGRFVTVNPAMARILGFASPAELMRERSDIAQQGYADPARREEFKRLLAERGNVSGFEYETLRKDGSRIWVSESARAVRDEAGRIVCYEGTMKDISERKQAEAAAQANERRFRALIEHGHDGIALFGADGSVLYASPSTTSILGYPTEEIRQHNALEYIHPDWQDAVRAHLAESLRRPGVAVPAEGYVRHKDGQWRFLEGTFTNLLQEPGIGAIVNNFRDATERKRTEAALRASEEKFQNLFESSPDAIIVGTRTGAIHAVNRQAERMFGYQRDELIGQPVEKLMPHRIAAGHAVLRDEFVRDPATRSMGQGRDLFARRKDGSEFPVDISLSPLTTPEGTLAISTIRDITERKRVEAALREVEVRFRTLFDRAPAGVVVIDPATARVIECSELAARQLGYTSEEFTRLGIADFEAVETGEQTRAHVEKILGEGRDTFETRHRTKTGELRDVLVTTQLIELSGRPVCHCIFLDITERKRAEAALRASEAALHRAQAVAQTGSWHLDVPRDILTWSAEAHRIFGLPPGTPLTYETFLECVHPEDRATVDRAWQAALRGAPYDIEHRIIAGGTMKWVREQARLEFDAAGRPLGGIGTTQDITDRKRVETALNESRQLLEQAQQIGRIGSWSASLNPQDSLFWSAETCRIFGLAPDAFDGRVETFYELVHPDDREMVRHAARAALARKRTHDFEYRIVRRDGQTRWVHEQADVERDDFGKPVRRVGVVQDITDRKQLEERLRQSQKMEAVGQLAGGIAHDFNNIIGAILGNTELLRLMPAGSREAGECLDSVLAASRRASDLVRQILAFSRRQEAQREPMHLHLVVKETLQLLRATVPAAIEFRARITETPAVLANPSEMHQVTMNLCTNAWHAMREGGPGILQVELAETEVDTDFARFHPDLRPGRYVCLTVTDNGCGMDAATLEHIFEPFFTTKPVGEGTGLGLSVVHGIMKNHDGGIVVRSQPGQGTTFALYFPVFEAEAVEAPAEPQPIPHGQGEHILFVDDEEPLARMGVAALGRLGYHVTARTSPAEALALFRADPAHFALVITDLNMPGLNGSELARQLLELRPEVPLILTTGYSTNVTEEVARELGFRELLPKPYDLRSLGEAAHRVLNETSLSRRP